MAHRSAKAIVRWSLCFILTKIARANGITETPFNIIREKIGLASKDEFDLISRGVR